MKGCRTDANHADAARALRIFGFPFVDLSAVGHGCEDFLVGILCGRTTRYGLWVVLEMKVDQNKGPKERLRFTPAQLEWQRKTGGFPRIVATSAEDAIRQLREMQA